MQLVPQRIQIYWFSLFAAVSVLLPAPVIAGDCAREAEIQVLLRTAQSATWDAHPIISFSGSNRALMLEGRPVEPFVRPREHHWGISNEGIFSLERDSQPRLIKLLTDGSSLSSDARYTAALRGTLLGAALGGPKVFRFGRIRLLNGRLALFIEMEWIFRNQPNFTWKGIQGQPASRFSFLIQGTVTPLEKIAALFVTAFEHQVAPGIDLDFIFSNDDVRWIDTADWRVRTEIDENLFTGLEIFVGKLHRIQPVYAMRFKTLFRNKLTQSSLLSDHQKRKMLHVFDDENM